jgi:hypothetical protein
MSNDREAYPGRDGQPGDQAMPAGSPYAEPAGLPDAELAMALRGVLLDPLAEIAERAAGEAASPEPLAVAHIELPTALSDPMASLPAYQTVEKARAEGIPSPGTNYGWKQPTP